MEDRRERYGAMLTDIGHCWEIHDLKNVPFGSKTPDKQIMRLNCEQVEVLLKEVAKTNMINRVLSKQAYDKQLANRHLDIIEKLIDVNATPSSTKV